MPGETVAVIKPGSTFCKLLFHKQRKAGGVYA